METLLAGVNWQAVVAGGGVAFLLGWFWYSPKLFGTRWAADNNINTEDASGPMWQAMAAQIVATGLLAVTIGVTAKMEDLALAVLILITTAALMKANGLFVQKTKYVIMVDVLYLLLMGAIMIAAHALL